MVCAVVGIFSAIPLNLVVFFQKSKIKCLRIFGGFLMIVTMLGCFYIVLTYAAILGVEEANKWTLEYVMGFLNDFFFIQIISGIIKIAIIN
jgi:hypothetical protein